MKKLMKLKRLINQQKQGVEKQQKQFQVDDRIKEQVQNLATQTYSALEVTPGKSKTLDVDHQVFDNFKFTSIEDFKFMTNRQNQKPVDCNSNHFFMHLRNNDADGKSLYSKSQAEIMKDLKIEPPQISKDDEASNANSALEKRPGDKVYADNPPSFYNEDYEKYIKKFETAITERSVQKQQLKKLFRQDFSKTEDQYSLPVNGFKRRIGNPRPPSRHSNTNHSNLDVDYRGNFLQVSQLVFELILFILGFTPFEIKSKQPRGSRQFLQASSEKPG